MSGRDVVFHCYLATTKHKTRLVYFQPECDVGRAWLVERTGAKHLKAGIWVSCARTLETDLEYRDESHASLLARIMLECGGFSLQLQRGAPPGVRVAADAPGFGYRLGGEIEKRLYVREPIPAPPKKTRTGRV